MTNPLGCLLLDASCLLNLYATERMQDIAASVGYEFVVSDYVLEHEALYILRQTPSGDGDERVPVNLNPLVDEGLIRVSTLEHREERDSFVQLASIVDDGEAATGALALHRGCSVAIDDRKARRVFGEVMPDVQMVSTLELMRLWVGEALVPQSELRDAMTAMRSAASYAPGRRDPLFEWWLSVMTESKP